MSSKPPNLMQPIPIRRKVIEISPNPLETSHSEPMFLIRKAVTAPPTLAQK